MKLIKRPDKCVCGGELSTRNFTVGTPIHKIEELDEVYDWTCLCGRKYRQLRVMSRSYPKCWFRILKIELEENDD